MYEHSPSSHPVYQTDLAQTPLPEILLTIFRYKAPGAISCRRGNEQKEIYLERGEIIFATSNQVRDSLGDKLLRDGRITREQYDESVRRLLSTGKRQGTILTEMQIIAPAELFIALGEQIQDIVWSVFAWEVGSISFSPGRPRHLEFIKTDIAIPQAIMEGVRHMPDAKSLIGRIGTKTTILARTESNVPGLQLDGDEERLLECCNGRRTLYELVNTPPLSAAANARILYALFALQLIGVKLAEPIKVQVRTEGGSHSR